MKQPSATRLLSFLLACALFGQLVLGVAQWYCLDLDVSQAVADGHSDHCLAEIHPAEEPDTLDHHHHRCCHTTPSNIAVPAVSLTLLQSITLTLIPLFSADPYRNPLIDLLIRPPIA